MHDRRRARQILEQARELLTERLSERVVDLAEEILEDARGDSFSSEIETIHEQIAARLQLVNQMLSNLPSPCDSLEPISAEGEALDTVSYLTFSPATESAAHDEFRPASRSMPSNDNLDVDRHFDARDFDPHVLEPTGPGSHAPGPHAPGPHAAQAAGLYVDGPRETSASELEHTAREAPTFGLFLRQMLKDHHAEAGLTLSALLGLSPQRGHQCARRFGEQLRDRPEFLSQAMGLRVELASGSVNTALSLLSECFGLDGLESAVAWNRLRQ